MLVFEGVKEDSNSYFSQYGHLTGASGICNLKRIGKVSLSKIHSIDEFSTERYEKKSYTWVTTRNKIEFLIGKIQRESEKDYPFFLLGEKSFLSDSAEVYNICNKLLGKLAEYDKNLFLRLYDSWKNEKKCTGMSKKKFNREIQNSIKSCLHNYADLFQEDVEYNFNTFMDMFDEESVSQEMIHQQSCYTWSKNHLQSIGLVVNEPKEFEEISEFVSHTLLVLTNDINADINGIVMYDTDLNDIDEKNKSYEHRVVTYKKNRDTRTHAKKTIENGERNVKIKGTAGIVGGSLIIPTIGAVVASFFNPLSAIGPAIFTGSLVSGLAVSGGTLASVVCEEANIDEKKKDKDLLDEMTALEKDEVKYKMKQELSAIFQDDFDSNGGLVG